MSENWELAPSSINNDMAEMQRKLRSISEMERVLNERSVRREACRYLLDAHRILSRDAFEETQLWISTSLRTSESVKWQLSGGGGSAVL